MEEISTLAAAETVAILNKTDVTMVSQIPYKIIKGLIDKAEEYEGEIPLNKTNSIIEQPISEEARSILLILYREYWSTEEEKETLDKQLIESEKEFNKLESERLDPFKDSKKDFIFSEIANTETTQEITKQSELSGSTALIELPKKWYVRIFNRIIRFFKKK